MKDPGIRKQIFTLKTVLFAAIIIVLLFTAVVAFWVISALSDLPDVASLKQYRPAAAAEILDKDGSVLTSFFDRKFRIWVPISSLPDIVIHAVITAEDDTFFAHSGVNYKATWEALKHDVQKGRFARGGSTITQQMIKNVLLSREKTLTRKLREYVLARKAEEVLTKRQILQIYLNEVEWGDNIYGIEAASRFYFDKHAAELTPAEAALLAGMLPNPRYFNPYKRMDKAKDRQQRVLSNMLQAKLITAEQHAESLQNAIRLRQEQGGKFYFSVLKTANGRPCYHYAIEQILLRQFGEQKLYRGGLTLKTTLDKILQDEMNGFEEWDHDKSTVAPDDILLIKQNNQIRAIVCTSGKKDEIREKLLSPFTQVSDYEMVETKLDAVVREEIILSAEGGK